MTQAVPGWYDDGAGRLRWWDGAAWTGDFHDPAGPLDATGPADSADPIRSLRLERADDEAVDPVVAWAQQRAAAQEQEPGRRGEPGHRQESARQRAPAPHAPDAPAVAAGRPRIVEQPRPRRRALPWVLGGLLGVIVLAGAGGVVWYAFGGAGTGVDEGAASVVRAYDRAWADGDCAQLQGILTEAFLADTGWDDCDAWATSQRSYLLSYDDYRTAVDATVVQGDIAWVDTSERFTPSEGGGAQTAQYRYELVRADEVWLIDALSER